MFNRERPPLAVLLEPQDVVEDLRRLHQPVRGALRAGPNAREFCAGCGGLTVHPCPTLRVLNGEPVEAVDVVGAPYRMDEVQS